MEQPVQTRLHFEDIQITNRSVKAKGRKSGKRKTTMPVFSISSIQKFKAIKIDEVPSAKNEFRKNNRSWGIEGNTVYGRFIPFVLPLVVALGIAWAFFLIAPPLIITWYSVTIIFFLSWLAMRGKDVSGHIETVFNKIVGQKNSGE